MLEYAAALEEQVTAFQASGWTQSVFSDFSSSASIANTINTDSANPALLKEIQAKHKEQVGQIKQHTVIVATMKGNSTPAEPNPRDRVRRQRKKPIRTCANCKKT